MKKYIIVFCLFCLGLFLIDNAYAATQGNVKGWGFDILHPTIFVARGCTSSACSNTLSVSTNYETDTQDNFVQSAYYTTSSVSTSTTDKSILFVFNVQNTLRAGYLYSITGYMCNNKNAGTYFLTAYSNNNQTDTINNKNKPIYISSGAGNTISNEPYYNGNASSSYRCAYENFFIVPSVNSQYIGLKIRTTSNVSSSWDFHGYSVTELGQYDLVTNSSLTNAIKNSNLASATSVEEVQQAQQEIKQEITGMQDKQQQTNDKLDSLNGNITNSDSSDATNDAGGFFEGFTTDTFGLTSIITSPLNLIQSITSKTCSPLTLQVPFVNKTMELPCMSTIYSEHFGTFLTIYQTITFGIISYWVCVRIFALVKDFKNPDHDEVEVIDL